MPYADMYLQKDAMVAAHEMLIAATDANMDKYGPITIDTAYGLTTHLKGHSQEIGTALTIYLSDENSDTGAYKALPQGHRDWFDKNAYKYGFIESFEDGYRYVGAPHAKLIKDNDDISTLADYIAFLKDKTGYDKTVRVKVDGVEYAVYYVACEEGQTIKVPANNTYTISGTNEGGVIITVKLSK